MLWVYVASRWVPNAFLVGVLLYGRKQRVISLGDSCSALIDEQPVDVVGTDNGVDDRRDPMPFGRPITIEEHATGRKSPDEWHEPVSVSIDGHIFGLQDQPGSAGP